MRLRVVFNLAPIHVDNLWSIGALTGYQRVDPTKPWSIKEKRDCARFAIAKLVKTAARAANQDGEGNQ